MDRRVEKTGVCGLIALLLLALSSVSLQARQTEQLLEKVQVVNQEMFFRVFLKGGRLIFLSNSFLCSDHAVASPAEEKEKLKSMLHLEIQKNKKLNISFRTRMLSLVKDLKSQMDDMEVGLDPEVVRRAFIEDYLQYLKEYRNAFLHLSTQQYIKLADYLRNQEVDKWVFDFFQVNNFFVPITNSSMDEFLSVSDLYPQMQHDLYVADAVNESDVGKYFINSGAAFHTLFMTHRERMPVGIPDVRGFDLEKRKIASDAEDVLSQVTRLTGGEAVDSNKAEQFYQRVLDREDICYFLYFVPEPGGREQQVKLIAKNQEYKLVYDDQKRTPFMKRMLSSDKGNRADVKVSILDIREGVVSLKLEKAAEVGIPSNCKLRLHIQVISEGMAAIVDRSRDFDLLTAEHTMQIKLPGLKHGAYTFIAEAMDLASEKNDVAIYPFSVK